MPRWLGWLAVVAGIGSIYQGYFVGHNGFSVSGNILAIAPTYITFAWVLVAAVTMWLRSRKLGASGHASVEGAVQPTA